MTRFKNKIGKKWEANPNKHYSQRFLRIMEKLQENCAVHAATPDDTVVECFAEGGCKRKEPLCLGRDWHKHKGCYEN